MPSALSMDLRERVIAAIEAGTSWRHSDPGVLKQASEQALTSNSLCDLIETDQAAFGQILLVLTASERCEWVDRRRPAFERLIGPLGSGPP